MLKPKKNFFIKRFFTSYIAWIIRRGFSSFNYNDPGFDPSCSILLISNHFTWWDGFLMHRLNQIFFKKEFHVLILEESYKKLSFLKYIGGFTVTKNSRQMLETIDYAATLLNNPRNLVLIFPQGKLYSNFVDTVIFEKGVFKIASKAEGPFQYLFATIFVENFAKKKPGTNIYLKTFRQDDFTTFDDLQSAYNQHYLSAKQQQTSMVV